MTYVDHTGLQTDEMEYQEGARPIWGGGPSGLGLGDAVARFGKHLVNWLATFGPGRVGKAAGVVEIATESGDGDASLIPLIGGATGVLARFLKSQQNQKKLSNLLKKHLVGSPADMDCEKTAKNLMRGLKELGVPAKYFNFKSKTRHLYHDSFGTFSNDGTHTAIVIGDHVFDKITGPSGLHLDAYQTMMKNTVRSDHQYSIVTNISSIMGKF